MRQMGAKAGGRQPGRVDGFIDRARGLSMSMHNVRSKQVVLQCQMQCMG
jgi:hypothetical protein